MDKELSTHQNHMQQLSFIMVLSLREHMRMEDGKKEHSLGQEVTNMSELTKIIKDGMVT